MSQLPNSLDGSSNGWRLDYYEVKNLVTGSPLQRPIITNGQCRVTALKLPGPLAHLFKYEDTWGGEKIEFEFQAKLVGDATSTTYQVFLGWALEELHAHWVGSPRDNDLVEHLMSNIRQALCLLKSGYSEDSRIRRVEFVLSIWSRWKTLLNFKTAEVVL